MEGARYLDDGRLTIFKRSGIYYARLRTSASGEYIWSSLKTTNEQTAIDLGRRLLFQIEQRFEQGLPPKSKSFAAVIDDYIRYRERDRHGKTSAGMLRQIGCELIYCAEHVSGIFAGTSVPYFIQAGLQAGALLVQRRSISFR
ncbi:hypothetical protein V1292_001261 [Bradyrhizobium sp. AZCC 1719]